MSITRVADTDDDGSGTTGTVHNNAWKTQIWDAADARWSEASTTSTGNQDNFAYSEADVLRCNNASTITLRGLLAPASPVKPGKRLIVVSVGAGTVVLNDQDTNSTAANRIITGTSAAMTLAAGTGWAWVEYDSVTARWRVVGASALSGIPNPIVQDLLFTDATYDIGKSGATRPRDLFTSRDVAVGRNVVLAGSTSGSVTVKAAAVAGSNTLTLPAGTTDLSATGGTSQVVKQVSAGAALTVGQLAHTDLSDYTAPTAVAYASGNFTASAGTWTVDNPGDYLAFSYQIVGKQMTIWFDFETTSVSTTPNTLNLAIPASKTCASRTWDIYDASDNGGASVSAIAFIGSGGTVIQLFKDMTGGVNNWSAATNATIVRGTLTFPIN